MKDLYVLVADADIKAFLDSILERHQALGIRQICFYVDRHLGRDSGMVKNGAELARSKKGKYSKALLMWDHKGSGRENMQPTTVKDDALGRLNRVTWENHSDIVILDPEFEEWIWYCEQAIADHFDISPEKLRRWSEECASRKELSIDEMKRKRPKELFEHIRGARLRRSDSPRNFEEIGKLASVNALQSNQSFREFVDVLRIWFPVS